MERKAKQAMTHPLRNRDMNQGRVAETVVMVGEARPEAAVAQVVPAEAEAQ